MWTKELRCSSQGVTILTEQPLILFDTDLTFFSCGKRTMFQEVPNIMSSLDLDKRVNLWNFFFGKNDMETDLTRMRTSSIMNEWVERTTGAEKRLRSHSRACLGEKSKMDGII